MTGPKFTPGPWRFTNGQVPRVVVGRVSICGVHKIGGQTGRFDAGTHAANGRLIAAAPDQDAALNYVADMTYCGADGEWHFKPGYDPQVVLDAIAEARGEP